MTNLGPAAATNVTAADLLPVNAIFVSASGGGSPSGGTVNWPAISSLASGTAANFTLTITTPASGSITNRATAASTTPDPNSGNNNGASASSQTITAIIVTNLQTVTANFSVDPTSGQVPLTVQFTDQSTGPIVSWNWDFGDGNISTSQNPIHIYNSAGSFAARLTVAGSSGQTSGTVRTINVTNIASAMFDILAGTVYLNPQTGLFEQSVSVTNTGSGLAAAVRLHVDGLRSGVQLYNASGTDAGRPYAQYNLPLEPDQVVTFLLEFYVPDRSSFGDTLTVETATPASAQLFSGGFAINRAFMDTNSPGSPRVVIEFNTVPGGTYTVIYSDDGMVTWNAATPSITASSTVTQWYDNGPPDTSSRPVSVGGRIYHVITGPVTP